MAFNQTPRHRWVISKIKGFFEVEADVTDAFVREANTHVQLDALFSKDGPSRLLVFYQPRATDSETLDDAEAGNVPELYFTNGETEKMVNKCCYFVRTVNQAIETNISCDNNLIYGELTPDPLKTLDTALNKLYKPMLEGRSQWGQADKDQTDEFMSHLDRFVGDVQEALKSLVGGMELRKPDKRFDIDLEARKAEKREEVVLHVQSVLEDWCVQVESALETKEQDLSNDAGPMTELEYWRRRMQHLTSIIEQLKTKECRNVLSVMAAVAKGSPQRDAQAQSKVFQLLRRWKQIDTQITEAANEAKDNVKYLFTLEKFLEPLYTGTPSTIVDTLPALMNSIKMIHTIARYYSTNERMTGLFIKITNQMITNCKRTINNGEPPERMWNKDPNSLVSSLESCLKLNEAYQEQYRLTKDKLLTMPKGKQFDFSETQIFGKFDLFCRRLIKLIDMFSTIHQFQSLASHKMEGMEGLISDFVSIIEEFKSKRHDLLDFHNNKFDRDYVEFNVKISELESSLQEFINVSFDSITDIEQSLNLLKKFQAILQRDSLKSDLDSKFNVIFQNYGVELEKVQLLYEKHKHSPPIPRNLPPVAGNITWSRHLLKRIEEPMKKFETNQNVLGSKDAKRIIRTYNKVARTLVAFEYLWYQAWTQSIETAKAGLQATLIIRHPDDGNLYVNFDQEILQLIREAKCLDRMGIEIPESAKIVLLQEDKFKSYYNDLHYLLKEYERVAHRIIPVTSPLLKPHISDMEYKLRPGMVTLTWTSMNIDAYKHHIHSGLQKMEELVHNINDITENRIEKNLKICSKTMLVHLPADKSFSLDEFVSVQEAFVASKAGLLQGKNVEIETAVDDLIRIITSYPLDAHIEPVSAAEISRLKNHYNHFMYQATLNSTKNSLNAIKKRVGSRGGTGFLFVERPFFEVDVQLAVPTVRLSPSLDEVQRAINKSAVAVLKLSKSLEEWGQQDVRPENRRVFFERIAKDLEIVRVALLLTGSIQGTKNQVHEYLTTFRKYDWLWKDDKDLAYQRFMTSKPKLEDYERELKRFVEVENEISTIPPMHNIGALTLNTKNLKLQLKHEGSQWKVQYSDNLHKEAREKMRELSEYMKNMMNKLHREVTDLDSLRFVMRVLKEIRERESGIDMEVSPVLDMYSMLEHYLPPGYMDKDEMDQKSVLRSNWRKLVDHAEEVTDELTRLQVGFKRKLLKDIKEFLGDVMAFRNDYLANGPMVHGLAPADAVERLKRYHDEFDIRQRKYDLYHSGEVLFALKRTEYPELVKTKKELGLLDQLYELYLDVINTIKGWKNILWANVVENISAMSEKVDSFDKRCMRMPKRLRDWDAYNDLAHEIADFKTVLPLLQELSKESIKTRHWGEVMKVTGVTFDVGGSEFKLQKLLDADLVAYKADVEEICESADKQLSIETKMSEIKDRWAVEEFEFTDWKNRDVPILKGVTPIVEELEEAQLSCQTMLTMRHVSPFKPEVQAMLTQLSDTSDTLELWLKVQMLWCSLESVFLSGDIAKQMPRDAKKFAKIDKDWLKIMHKARETGKIVESCANELLRNMLPVMYTELEKCQKSLEGYLEQKRNKFPRFYFVSNPMLLQILSQGSEPQAVQLYYEKIFDSVSCVIHNEKDKYVIESIVSRRGADDEVIPLSNSVKCKGNIEEWLMDLLREMRATMKNVCRSCASDCALMSDVSELRDFTDKYPGQFSLLGMQLMWTADVQEALEGCKTRRSVMQDTNRKCLSVLTELSSWCLQADLTPMSRTKIETLVTVQVHQRDVMNDLHTLYKHKRINDANDFEWLKQARFYWRSEGDADIVDNRGCCDISITDVDFQYQYEYLGCKERLVITPLTDRCFITLAQAMGMCFGGAPAGPAGTGKTETVKDMGRALGLYVVVTNCTDQQRYTDCAKIFKGLCQGGMWGCFDEFNRIRLPVLSVVAQQVLAIQNAKKSGTVSFQFPGDPQQIFLNPACGFFITMNPGYAGRQELPENLKALFRGVAMMVPDREIIMKVKLCSVGYCEFTGLAKKFAVLYHLCEEQLSKQKHYDFGLRNILSVLRTAGKNKRENLPKDEFELLYRTLRDMNLSKFVAQDVPLFLSLLRDLFPSVPTPPESSYPAVEKAITDVVSSLGLVHHEMWVKKVVQLYETTLVRHGIMLVGPTGGGKTKIFDVLERALQVTNDIPYKEIRLNPKAIRAPEMYGEVDSESGEWTTGVFAAMWTKANNRANRFNTWLIADGPVDAIWIEDLNTVLDDNRILTLANGDRIPMTDNVKIMFENEQLDNASPATVSRAGIIYVSATDLDWVPYVAAWLNTRSDVEKEILEELLLKYVGEINDKTRGHIFDFLTRQVTQVLKTSRIGRMAGVFHMLTGLLAGSDLSEERPELDQEIERMFLFSLCWGLGGLLEPEDRVKFDQYLRSCDTEGIMPEVEVGETLFEFYVDPQSAGSWDRWSPPVWEYPAPMPHTGEGMMTVTEEIKSEQLDFSNLLVPTLDSTRALYVMQLMHKQRLPVLMVGGPGTAKTSTALMFFQGFESDHLVKRINFSYATTPNMFQKTVENSLEKRGGKNFGPPSGHRMTLFVDDVSMPEINDWGDQPTLELVRQLVETCGFAFLDKDKRGDLKLCEDLQYVAAMSHPMGGKNDIPNRCKRHFFTFNMILPSITSIDDIYGQMLRGRFAGEEFSAAFGNVVDGLTRATIQLWRRVKQKMLPTPAKFHYVFSLRDLSRVFQGILLTPKMTLLTGGLHATNNPELATTSHGTLLGLWRHECERVFCDKLVNDDDKLWFTNFLNQHTSQHFPELSQVLVDELQRNPRYVTFMRDDIIDEEDDIVIEDAPLIYEPGGTVEAIRSRVQMFMDKHNEDPRHSARPLNLILFDDAMNHLLRIVRVINMPRGSALLVGVGGSGKQSLTRLAAYIARQHLFQIKLTKSYGVKDLIEDLRELYKVAGHQRKPVTFVFTDQEIKDESFLEYINNILMTGEVAGLFAKDEMLAMCGDLRPSFAMERPGMADSQDNLNQFFIDMVRDNLHLVLCMSPVNPKFPERARKFPGLINCCIDWFLPWPEEALSAVSRGFIGDFNIDCSEAVKESLILHMGAVHINTVKVCEDYFSATRRRVSQTPKSYLAFLENYKSMYAEKLHEINVKERNVNLGLLKLIKGAEDVEAMKVVLAQEQEKLDVATEDTNRMLGSLEVSSLEAKKESDVVEGIKQKCEADQTRISAEKALCEEDLSKAQPFVTEAEVAIKSIKPAHINEIKKLPKPADIIRLVFDGVLLLFQRPLNPVSTATLSVSRQEYQFINPSFNQSQQMMNDSAFLRNLLAFGENEKDQVNEETIELLTPYIEFEHFNPKVAKAASVAAEGLCTFVRAMKFYYEASKIVKPKLEALQVAEGHLQEANKALSAAQDRLDLCKARLTDLQTLFEEKMQQKQSIEEGALRLKRKMEQASSLIVGLSGERVRWNNDANSFADTKNRLVGDCAVACAFTSYCGPFNQEYRQLLVNDRYVADCESRGVPVTRTIDVASFMVDLGTVGDWNMQGLPTDPLSVQNGILVTNSSRYPLLIDPQGQALNWIMNKEAARLPHWGTTQLSNTRLRDQLEHCLVEGKAMVITAVEQEIDPMLDPLLEKQIVVRGKGEYITIGDKACEFNRAFNLYFITRLPNPHFSPELQAKTTVVDFTVTMKGLEEQLLGKVIQKEQKALEEQLTQVLESVNANTKSLLQLDAELLSRLTSNEGNLLDDVELVGVLENTKAKATEVQAKLEVADETRASINEKREQYRPVATRGSVLYFSIVEMCQVNFMYQTSLNQFMELFMKSMDEAERAGLASKRVANIILKMTYIVYRYINRGLYECDKLTFVLMVTTKIMMTAGLLSQNDMNLFMRGGAGLDQSSVRRKPFDWMTSDSWLNVVELSNSAPFFKSLPDTIARGEAVWRRWYEENEPESLPIPDYEGSISEHPDLGPWLRLLLVRSLRMDRTILTVREFIRRTTEMGPKYVEPVTDTIDSVYAGMSNKTPVIFLLSVGADPTDSIEVLCRRKKQTLQTVSMGEGQEVVALKAINAAAVNGSWVLLQNCELGLELMDQMEEILVKFQDQTSPPHPDFRLFITAAPHPLFPLGLLQMCTKVTNEPPAGLRAGLLRSYTVMVDQDRLERVETSQWRQLLYVLCFTHSIVQERRKFGSLGWCIPYEYNNGDLGACIQFLEKHIYSGALSWPTVQYMVSEVQYGGKITDDMDRRMFKAYAELWLRPEVLRSDFAFNPAEPINRISFKYFVPDHQELKHYTNYLQGLPEIDSPEIFGLHPNADLTFRVKEANLMLNTISETQPKVGSTAGGRSREDIVNEKAQDLLKLPENYVKDEYMAKLDKQGGLSVPLNMFLYQEIQRLQAVIELVRGELQQLQLAIKGEVVMTPELADALNAIYDARVPNRWTYTLGGDEFSWISPTLGHWYTSLLERDDQARRWLHHTRPNTFWLTGFFNPQGFLTAMKQEVTRDHKADRWALDDVVYHTEVTEYERPEQVRAKPQEGVYVHGLFLDGAAWHHDPKNKTECSLQESEPKKLFAPLPVLYVTAVTKAQKKARAADFGSAGPYDCPLYKYPARTDRYFIFMVTLPPGRDVSPNHWVLRGVALLCTSD